MKPIFKKAAILLLFAIALAAFVTLCGCNPQKDNLSEADYIFDSESGGNSGDGNSDGSAAVDVPTVYTVTYANGGKILTTKLVLSNSQAENLQIDNTDDYEFAGWNLNGEEYDFSAPVTNNIRLDARWKAIEHTATFYCKGKVVGVCKFSAENKQIEEPEPTEEPGYIIVWEDYELGSQDVEIHAYYQKITYSLQFFAEKDGELLKTLERTIDEINVDEFPPVPEREGYSGEWAYEGIGNLIKFYPEYTKLPSTAPDDGDDEENKKPPVEERPDDTENKLTETEGLTYAEIEGGLEVTGYDGDETKIVIPSTHDGKAVISVGAYAFKSSTITELYICEGVKTIKSGAFYICAALEKVTLPESLESIERSAFDHSAIKEIVLPSKIKVIEVSTFADCKNLETVTLPDGLTSICANAFKNCEKLKNINLFSGLDIHASAFTNCPYVLN